MREEKSAEILEMENIHVDHSYTADDIQVLEGLEAVRLDAQLGNGPLNAWYARQGYLPQGTMREGSYEGILREKLLKNRSC